MCIFDWNLKSFKESALAINVKDYAPEINNEGKMRPKEKRSQSLLNITEKNENIDEEMNSK